jgi:hypothetical protein
MCSMRATSAGVAPDVRLALSPTAGIPVLIPAQLGMCVSTPKLSASLAFSFVYAEMVTDW